MSGRHCPVGFGGLVRPPLRVSAALATLVVLGACSTAADPTTTSPPSLPASTVTSPSSSSSTTSTSVLSSTSTSVAVPGDDVLVAWGEFWDAWVEVRASDDLDVARLNGVASEAVTAGVVALFERERSSGSGPVGTGVELHPVFEVGADSVVVVEDCVLLSPSFTDTAGVWYRASLTRGGEGWIVDSLEVPSAGGCVPAVVAAAAIAGYDAYYDAQASFWDPPDPASPLVDEVLAEPQKSFIVGLLEEHQAAGVALRGQPTTHPEVIELRSPKELVVLSCLEPSPDFGLYDLDTGERLPDEPPVREGQRDLESAVMVLEDGVWKVSDLQGQVDFSCEFAPTDRGLPTV